MTDGTLALDATAKALTAAKSLGEVTVLCCGARASAAAEAAAKLEGVAKVLCAEDARYGHRLAEPAAALVVSLAGEYEHIVAPATTDAKNIMPRVAALLDVMVIPDVTAVKDAETFERPVYAGNAMQTVRSKDGKKVVTFRTSTFEAAPEGGGAPVERVEPAEDPGLSSWIEDKVAASDRPELTSAKIIVSGGRGIGSQENFAMVEQLADKLGAAVGASRAAVDSGYAPNDWQVGQTGKVVAPDLYIALGHLGRDPAPRRHEGQPRHRRHQQGRGRADLPGRRLRAGGGSVPGRAGVHRAGVRARAVARSRSASIGAGSAMKEAPTSGCAGRLARRLRTIPALVVLLAACAAAEVAPVGRAGADPIYASMADTAFDLIETSDPTAFVCLDYDGRVPRAIWDKRVDSEPTVEAYAHTARFADGLTTQVAVNPEFGSEAAARAEAVYHMTALGRIPTRLREGVGRFGIHDGTPTFSAGPLGGGTGPRGERGRIIAYAERARMRAARDGLEETMFHEAVHTPPSTANGRAPRAGARRRRRMARS